MNLANAPGAIPFGAMICRQTGTVKQIQAQVTHTKGTGRIAILLLLADCIDLVGLEAAGMW